MPKTKTQPGPKPGEHKIYGKRRDYHIKVSEEIDAGAPMSLADAFEEVAKQHGGIVAYTAMLISKDPEIRALLKKESKT